MAEQAKPALTMREVVRDANHLAEKRKELDVLRQVDNRDWALNKEFHRGNQYAYWPRNADSLVTLGVDEGDKPRWKVRLVSNAIKPGVKQLVAQMTKTRPVIRATPNSGGDRDMKAAQMAERLYEHWWDAFGLRAKLVSALTNAQISQGYWLITWDGLAGSSMKVMRDPETGTPIWDDEFADIYREEIRSVAEQMGIPAQAVLDQFEQQVYMGDIRVQVLSGSQVWLDPTALNYEDAQYAICKFPMSVDEIEARYGKKVTPDSTTSDDGPVLNYITQDKERPKNVRDVYCLYHRKGPALPGGRYVCWIEGPNEILYESAWEFPFDILNLVKFPGIERPGSVYDDPRVTDARPIQKELNDIISGVAMHRRMTMKPQVLAPVGSLRQRLTDEAGAVIEFAPIQGLAPVWREMPQLPSYIRDNLTDVQLRLDNIFNKMPTERSALPARTDSGHLVELVQEAVADQISDEIGRMEMALARAGDIMAAFAQKFYTEPRLLRIKGPGGSIQVKKFLNVDISGGYSFEPEAGSGLPRTRAGQVQQIKEMIEMGVLDPREASYYLPMAGLKGVQQRLAAAEEFASRAVEKLVKGEPLNVPALQSALQHVQMDGRNPATGDFFTSPEEALAFVQEAALAPLPQEDIQVSLRVTGLHMMSSEFDKYPPEIQQRFYTRLQTLQTQAAQMAPQPEAVKNTVSWKGTFGPSVGAKILQQQGIDVTPEELRETPLETSVYDSVDKPDADEAGNDPLEDEEKMMAMAQAEATHLAKMGKAAKDLARADEIAGQDDEERLLKQEREEELHQERLTQMRKPKPASKAA